MKFTIAIVTHGRPSAVARLLTTLRKQTISPSEILVINNGDDDQTKRVVKDHQNAFGSLGSDLRVWNRDDTNLPAGRNVALRRATGDVICYLDDDTIPAESWLEEIREGYELHDAVIGVGGPSIAVDRTLTPQLDLNTGLKGGNRLNRYGEVRDNTHVWIPPYPIETDLLQGSNMSFRKGALESIGGFDPEYSGYPLFEDTDVMAKCKKKGMKLVYHPGALVLHERVARDDSIYYWYWYARNSVRFRRQNFPERYHRSLLRLLVWKRYHPPSLLKQIVLCLLSPKKESLNRIVGCVRGYIDELLKR